MRAPHALTHAEIATLRAIVAPHRLAALFDVAVILGLRLGELLGLRWQDYSREKGELRMVQQVQELAGVIHIGTPKTKNAKRTLPVPPAVAASLDAHFACQQAERQPPDWQEHLHIFAASNGNILRPTNFEKTFRRLCHHARLDHLTFHDLRHTSASQLANLGVSEIIIAAILGHSNSASITKRYIKGDRVPMRAALTTLAEHVMQQAA